MPKLTNISTGDRGLHTAGGLIMVPAGATVDVDLAKNEEPNEEWFAPASSKAAKEASDPLDHDGNGKKGRAAPAKD